MFCKNSETSRISYAGYTEFIMNASGSPAHLRSLPATAWYPWAGSNRRPMSSLGQHFSQISILEVLPHPAANP